MQAIRIPTSGAGLDLMGLGMHPATRVARDYLF